ncbi:MAG: DUF1320 domain-containing protein [Desulfobacteraceae bacterium]|nr:DUF1320 domain-containing protein [Desulfobacteraceae bacterium]
MAYCTQADILKEIDESVLIELTDLETPTGAIVTANVDSAIVRAGAIIDGYLSRKMSVPADVTPTLTALAVDLAIYTLMSRKENVTKQREARYDSAMAFLKAVVDGTASIGVESDTTSRYALHFGPPPDFGPKTWRRY